MWKQLNTVGTTGSENGIILADEEYEESCHITLEKCARYYAVTCGVYGLMCHTVFSDLDGYRELYDVIKKELQNFIDQDMTEDETITFCKRFIEKY